MPNDAVNGFSYNFSKKLYDFLLRTGESGWFMDDESYQRAQTYHAYGKVRGVVKIAFIYLAEQMKSEEPITGSAEGSLLILTDARILMKTTAEFLEIFENPETKVGEVDPFQISTQELLDNGYLLPRTYNALRKAGLINLGLIVQQSEYYFRNRIQGIGPTSLTDLKGLFYSDKFSKMNLCLGMNVVNGKLVRPKDFL